MTHTIRETLRAASKRASTEDNNPQFQFGPRRKVDPSSLRGKRSKHPGSLGVLHRSLRAATRNDHAMTDLMILRFDLACPQDYALFLNAHYSALRNLEADWRQEDHSDFSRMTRCLQEDLDALGIAAALLQPPARSPLPTSGRLGIAYVIRGSRLGARFLRRLVPSPLPASYLNFVPGLPWNQFLLQLATVADDPSPGTTSAVIQGARITFEIFIGLLSQALARPVEPDEALVSLPLAIDPRGM